MLVDSAGARKLAFQQVDRLSATTWPEHDVPMQLHVDFTVSSRAELARQRERERAEALVGVVFFLAGAWQLARGLRSGFQRRPRPSDDES